MGMNPRRVLAMAPQSNPDPCPNPTLYNSNFDLHLNHDNELELNLNTTSIKTPLLIPRIPIVTIIQNKTRKPKETRNVRSQCKERPT